MQVATARFNQQKIISGILVFALVFCAIFISVPEKAFAGDTTPVASFTGTNVVSERDVNKDGLTIRIAPPEGYTFDSVNLAVYKDDIIDGLTFYGMKFDKTVSGSNYYTPMPWDTYITSVLNLYGTTSGDETYFSYLDYANQVTVYDRFVGLNPLGAKSHVTNPSDALKAQYPGVKQGIINALKAGATVSIDANGNLVIYCSKDAADGYFANFTSDLPVCDGGIAAAASGDIALSATLPAGVVNGYSQPITVNNYFLIQEIKAHVEVWQYVDASQADEPGVYAFDRKVDNTGTTYYTNATGTVAANGKTSTLTYYIKRVPGDVLTEDDIRNGGTLGPNGTGNKLIKMVVDVRSGPTQWAEGKPKLSILYNMFRTSKIATGYGYNDSNNYTPADDPEWSKVENKIVAAATAKTVGSDKYAVNYSGDSRRDTVDPKNMWMFWELPQTSDFDISSDMTVYLNEIGGFFGGSGQMIGGDTFTGLPFSGMDGRYSFTIKADSAVATVTSAVYAVSAGGTAAETITNVPYNTSKASFLAALTKGEGNQTWDTTNVGDPVATGNTLDVTAQDGTTKVTYTVTVNPASVAVTGVTLDQDTMTLTTGGAIGILTATVAPADATNKNVTWTSSDSNVATVNNGVVTPVGAGTATITITTADGSFTAVCQVTVNAAAVSVTGVTLDQGTMTLTAGGATGTLTATVAPENATNKNVTWTTSNSNVAIVDNGVVTPVGNGTTTITVTTADGGFTATCQVTVNAAATDNNGGSNSGSSSGSSGAGSIPATTQAPATDLGQVTKSGNTATLQVDAEKAADMLKDAKQSGLVVNLSQVTAESGQTKAVQLPTKVIDLAKTENKPIVIQDNGLKIVIPHEVLIQGQNMTFSTTQVSGQTVAPAPEHVEGKAVYSFDASAGETAVHNFAKSVTITLPIPAGVTEAEKLGVYYLNETTGQWDYMGGRIVDGKLVFNTNHFSKYMVAESEKTFGDIASHWAKDDIEVMVARHIITGIDANTFAPQNSITRAEFAALLSRVLKLTDAAENSTFKDVTGSEWYASDVNKAAKAGIILGSDGSFHPSDKITRQEMAVMINRAYSHAGGKTDTLKDLTFTDKGSISAWANDAVQSVYTLGIIKGRPDGSFGAMDNATRAEGSVMLKILMDKLGL